MSMVQTGSGIKFGTDGWRALMSADFTEANVDLVARAICSHVLKTGRGADGLIVGYDTRNNSRRFAEICAARAVEAGIPVYLPARAIPTPLTAFAILHHKTAGGFMITASHNPADYNGIKFISPLGGPSGPEVTAAIETEIEALGAASAKEELLPMLDLSSVQVLDIFDEYRHHLAGLIDFDSLKKAAMTVAVDPMFGAGHGLLSDILRDEAGCKVIALHDLPDPSFGGSMPDPSPSHLGELKEAVAANNCMVGLALDGDADRFGVIDSEGKALSPNQVLAVLADHLLARGMAGDIVRTVATTHLLDRIGASYGRKVIETPVGFKWIAAEMVSTEVLIGGEESGGLSIIGHMPEKDGLLADLLLAELAAECGGRLMAKFEELLGRHGHFVSKRFDLEIPMAEKEALLSSLKLNPPAELGGVPVETVKDIDGVKLILADGDWVLFRPSGTEPLVRIYVESSDPERFNRLSAAALAISE